MIPNGCDLEMIKDTKYKKMVRRKFIAVFTGAPGDPQAFSDALITLKRDRKLLNQMSQNVKKLAVSKFDRNKFSDQFVDFLEANTV